MKLLNKEHQYNVELEKLESVSIEVNGVVVFATQVPEGYKGNATFLYQEHQLTEVTP